MEPFDLERALAGEPVVTRNGKKVAELVLFSHPVQGDLMVGLIGNPGFIRTFERETGKCTYDRNLDLFIEPDDDGMRYFCVYKSPNGQHLTSPLFESRDIMIYWVRARDNSPIIAEFEIKIEV